MVKDKKQPAEAAAELPQFLRVELARITEPELAARAQMSEAKMRELIDSMREVGQIEPITLAGENGVFEIITGHRRYLAAQSLKWTHINALVYRKAQDRQLAMRLHENIIREDLNAAEEALYMAQAREKLSLDEAGLCHLFRRSPEYVGARFALLRGDSHVFAALQHGDIRLGVAQQLNRITDEKMRLYYLDCAKRSDPPAHVVHRWVEDWRMAAGSGLANAEEIKAVIASRLEANAGVTDATAGDPRAATGEPAGEAPFFGCALCGGTKDPWNFVTVTIHKWHWEEIQRAIERAAKAE